MIIRSLDAFIGLKSCFYNSIKNTELARAVDVPCSASASKENLHSDDVSKQSGMLAVSRGGINQVFRLT